MPTCASCEFFGKKGSVDWCYHVMKNWSTSPDNSACQYYRSKW